MKLLAVLVFLGAFTIVSTAKANILLFNNQNEFRGCLDCSRYSSDSVCNRYGTYGSRYSSSSIWNRFGAGSRYNSDSPFNRYGTGLKMVDNAGNFYGYLSMSISGERRMRNYLRELWEVTGGDHGEMRDIFCD